MRLDGFGIFVEDMGKMIRFYRDVLEPELETWGQRTCYIADPEGNLIEIGSWNKPYEEKDKTEG